MKKILGLSLAFVLLLGVGVLEMGQVADAIGCSWLGWNSVQPTCDEVDDTEVGEFEFGLGTTVVTNSNPGSILLYLEPAWGLSENIDWAIPVPGSYSEDDGFDVTGTGSYNSVVSGGLETVNEDGSLNLAAWTTDFLCLGNWNVDIEGDGDDCP